MTLTRRQMLLLLKPLTSTVSIAATCGFLCLAQTKPEIQQEAKTANCSNVVVTGGVATFSCTGLTPNQIKLLQDISATLTKILKQKEDLSAIKGLVNTEVGFHYKFQSTPFDANGNKTLILFETAVPANNIAKELRVIQGASLKTLDPTDPNASTDTNQNVWRTFARFALENRSKAEPSDIGLGQVHVVVNREIKLSRQNLDDMKHLKLRIYILSAASWKNVSGSRGSASGCVFLGSDISPDDDPYNILATPPVHICPSSVDDL